ncbi:hypothetical protein MalM25_00430 [Planctomycetes bacterium MalM25]|nr:hypothetical protein MalM25_00430 [Planctomycetes bacterium MalM25]
MSTQPIPARTAEEYLAFERASEERHEFVNGQIRLMSGASRAHNLIAMNLSGLVHAQLKGRPCEAYSVDMRVKIAEDGRYTYPDMAVVCDEPEFEDAVFDTLLNPNALVEILSPSTGDYDRGEKFASYRNLTSLREYVLISQHRPQVEHFVRLGDGGWRFSPTEGADGLVQLVTAEIQLPLAELYDKVRFDTDGEPKTN